jgi:flagellar motor protein MotB
MTDLMIGLLFIFIIMLMSFAINFREAETKSQDKQAEHEQTIRTLTDNQDTLEHILRSIERRLLSRGILVKILPDGLRLPEDILFDSGSATLTARGRVAVAALAEALEAILPCHANVTGGWVCQTDRQGRMEALLIEGHTDNVPIRDTSRFRDNWELSAARAIATYSALADRSPLVAHARNDRSQTLIGVTGYGEERRVEPNDTAEGRRANRRIDLRFLMAAPERPAEPTPGPLQ